MADQVSGGFFSPFLRRQRIAAVRPYVQGRVLDFGCGAGLLAPLCAPHSYLGVERDVPSLRMARTRFPLHHFQTELPSSGHFETVAALAVIEHLKNPAEVLRAFACLLAPGGRIVLTTPHPNFRSIHDLGARAGLFSREAADEHETFFDRPAMAALCAPQGLILARYGRFLLGANQLFVLARDAV